MGLVLCYESPVFESNRMCHDEHLRLFQWKNLNPSLFLLKEGNRIFFFFFFLKFMDGYNLY